MSWVYTHSQESQPGIWSTYHISDISDIRHQEKNSQTYLKSSSMEQLRHTWDKVPIEPQFQHREEWLGKFDLNYLWYNITI